MLRVNDQNDSRVRAMSHHGAKGETDCDTELGDYEPEPLQQILDELARLRAANDDLRWRVRRLEARSGQGLPHPSDYSDLAAGPGA